MTGLGNYAVVNFSDRIIDGELQSGLKELSERFGDPETTYLGTDPYQAIKLLAKTEYDLYIVGKGGTNCVELINGLEVPGSACIVGYSDITHLFPSFYSQGWRPIMGPTAGYFDIIKEESVQAFEQAFTEGSLEIAVETLNQSSDESLQGCIVCGNDIALLNSVGTEYGPRFQDKILFIENHTSTPKMVQYWLEVYKAKGILSRVQAVIIGHTSLNLDSLRSWSKQVETPLYHSPMFGEGNQNYPIPYGGQATVRSGQAVLKGFD